MDTTDFVTLVLLAVGGEVQGKTKLQKTVYLLGAITGCLQDLGYRPWFYGPYSDDVDRAVTLLKMIGAIDQNVSSRGFDQSGFEVRRYDFRLNEKGKKFAEIKGRQYPEIWQRLQQDAKRLREAGDIDYMEMSIAAKTHYMLGRKQDPATMAELAQLAPQFGWNVSPRQVQQAAQYLNRLGLVQLLPNGTGGS
jgi:uncharacterized protein YwgA